MSENVPTTPTRDASSRDNAPSMTEDNTIASEDMSRQSTGTTLLDRRGSNGMVIAPLHKTQSVALALPSPSDTYQPGKLTFPDANGRLQPNYFDTPKRSRRLQSPYNTVGLPRTLTQDRTNPEDMNEATSIDLEDHLGEEERLTDRQRHMAQLLRDSKDTTSYFSVIYFIGACVGKLVLGYGASLAVKGAYSMPSDNAQLATGIALAVLGFVGIVIAALGFGAAVQLVDRRMGIVLKCVSISAGSLIGAGYVLNQYFVSTGKPLFAIRLSFLPLCLGTGLMMISTPNFFASSSAAVYRGGGLFASYISGEHGEWPAAFNAAVLTFLVALAYFGVSLFWSNHLRREAEWADCCLLLEEERDAAARSASLAATASDAEKRSTMT